MQSFIEISETGPLNGEKKPGPLGLRKINEDNFDQLDDYGVPFCERQYTQGACYISLFKFNSFDQFRPPNRLKI